MDQAIRTAYEAARKVEKKPFPCACYAPYTSLYFNTNGDVVACCKSTSYPLGNIGKERLDDIWRGRRTHALRKALKSYNFSLGCRVCEWQINGGQFDQVYATTFDNLKVSSEEPEWPSRMEFTVSNTCNLACIMCYGELSSTIRANREKLPPLPKVYDDQFFADLRKYLPHLQEAKFFGGEPFLAQESYRIWDMMREDGVRIPIVVTTNGTQWNAKVERVLNDFHTHIAVSMDGTTKQTVESIRVNAHFETVRDNIGRFLEYVRAKKSTMSLTYCLMRQNWHEFGDYLEFGEERGLDVFINTVIDPKDCSLYTLPPGELLKIVEAMEVQDQKRGYGNLKRNGKIWRSAVAALHKNAREMQVEGVNEVKAAANAMRSKLRPDHVTKAWGLVSEGKFEEALAECRMVPSTDSASYEATVAEAHVLRRLRRFEESEAVLKRAIEQWRRSPKAHIQLAWLRFDQKRLEEALAIVHDAERMIGESGQATEAAGLAHLAAQILFGLGRKDDALVKLREIPADHPVAFEAAMSEAWLQRDRGRFAESEAAIVRAQSIRPKAVRPLIERAWLRVHEGRDAESMAAAEQAQQMIAAGQDPEQKPSLFHVMAVLCQRSSQFPRAVEWASQLVAARPRQAPFLVLRARLLAQVGRRDEALADVREAVAVDPGNAEAKALLGSF
jgi:radical SAM protein with 4Fe4S-binding SPASM domain